MHRASLGLLGLLLILALGLGSCALPGLEKSPLFHFTPEFTLYKLTGEAAVQTPTGTGHANNPSVRASDLAQDQRDAGDWGGTLSVGDGFSGLEFSYLHVDFGSTERGTLPSNFGFLQAGDTVWSQLTGDEWRAAYYGQVYEREWQSGVQLQVGPGLQLAHRELRFKAVELSSARQQGIALHDAVTPYLAARARATYKQFGLNVDYGINPNVHFGGDYDDVMHDLEVGLRWSIAEDQDVTLIVGYRRFDLDTKGHEAGARFTTDWTLDGYFFAVSVAF